MVRPGFVVALVAALAVAGASLAFTAASRARAQRADAASSGQAPRQRLRQPVELPVLRAGGRPSRVRRPAGRPAERLAPAPAQVLRVRGGASVALRDRPDGRVVARLGDRTQFGSPTTLSVAKRRGRWAGVPSSELANGRLGWVDTSDGAFERLRTDAQLTVSLGRRRLELRIRGRRVRAVPVAIGRPGSATPTGHFSITDKMAGGRFGPYYGCCILALSGHQPHPPPGWTGGDRLAIHGTNAPSTIGTPSSAGCLRAAEDDVRALMRRVPLGTPVVIRG